MEAIINLLAIVGPTASGKSELAMQIASKLGAEIICADSRTIYKGMDIGTAKPSEHDQARVKHWGLDLIDPGQVYSAALYQQYANKVIAQIKTKSRLPILVGGTGLYIDSVLYNFSFIPPNSSDDRQNLEHLTVNELRRIIEVKSYPMPNNINNKRHLIRTIERKGKTGSSKSLAQQSRIIGILPSDEILRENIEKRIGRMFENGVIAETEGLINKFGRRAVLDTRAIIYKICIQVLDGEISVSRAKELSQTADWQYARRQRTWFKRNKDIYWFADAKSANLHLESLLNT